VSWARIVSSSASLSFSAPLQSSHRSALSVIAMRGFGGGWPTAYDRAIFRSTSTPQRRRVGPNGRAGERLAAAGQFGLRNQSPTFAFITYPFGRLLSCGYREYGGKGSAAPAVWAESPSGTCSDGSTLVASPCAARRRPTGLAIDCGTAGYPCASSDEQNPGACRKPTSTAVECRDE
jgi:hypothetical protein